MIDKVKGYNTFLWVYTQKRHVHYEVKSFSRWKSPDVETNMMDLLLNLSQTDWAVLSCVFFFFSVSDLSTQNNVLNSSIQWLRTDQNLLKRLCQDSERSVCIISKLSLLNVCKMCSETFYTANIMYESLLYVNALKVLHFQIPYFSFQTKVHQSFQMLSFNFVNHETGHLSLLSYSFTTDFWIIRC